MEFAAADSVMDFARNAGAYSMRQSMTFRKVDTAEWITRLPQDWLNWRRTPDGHGHSPLTKITRDNVSRLEHELVNGDARRQQSAHTVGPRWRHVPDPCPQQDSGD